ncbi:MAG: ABC transporter ATP-binding protein [Clostridia bacterium]|nr:ABC transporter ATP-binding protein [Clostridia bacterium]
MIKLENVTKKYVSGKAEFYALNGVSVKIQTGEFVAVTGKSGSGKSTLLNIMGTLDTATQGSVFIDGVNTCAMDAGKLAAFRRDKMGFVFQSYYLENEYSVKENVEIPLILCGRYSDKKRVLSVLEKVGMDHKYKEKVKNLSGGEKQRAAIARAIVNNPDYIFADEPCGNLDSANSLNIMQLLKDLHSGGKTVIMVTHDNKDALFAQRIITIGDGKIINDESVAPCKA